MIILLPRRITQGQTDKLNRLWVFLRAFEKSKQAKSEGRCTAKILESMPEKKNWIRIHRQAYHRQNWCSPEKLNRCSTSCYQKRIRTWRIKKNVFFWKLTKRCFFRVYKNRKQMWKDGVIWSRIGKTIYMVKEKKMKHKSVGIS